MSCSYAEGLSEYHDKGKLGLPEKFDLEDEIRDKVETLTQWIREARHIVVHTGGSGDKYSIHILILSHSFHIMHTISSVISLMTCYFLLVFNLQSISFLTI